MASLMKNYVSTVKWTRKHLHNTAQHFMHDRSGIVGALQLSMDAQSLRTSFHGTTEEPYQTVDCRKMDRHSTGRYMYFWDLFVSDWGKEEKLLIFFTRKDEPQWHATLNFNPWVSCCSNKWWRTVPSEEQLWQREHFRHFLFWLLLLSRNSCAQARFSKVSSLAFVSL